MQDVVQLDPLLATGYLYTCLDGAVTGSVDGLVIAECDRVAGQCCVAVEPVMIGAIWDVAPELRYHRVVSGLVDTSANSVSECHSVQHHCHVWHDDFIGDVGVLNIRQPVLTDRVHVSGALAVVADGLALLGKWALLSSLPPVVSVLVPQLALCGCGK